MQKAGIVVSWPLTVVLAAIFGYGMSGTIDVNVRQADWMPDGATDGCRYFGGACIFGPPAYFYEYTISEADFLREFEKYSEDLREIDKPLWVLRYYWAVLSKADYDLDELDGPEAYRKAIHAVINEGLAYAARVEDRQKIIAYDRERGRAFVYYTTR